MDRDPAHLSSLQLVSGKGVSSLMNRDPPPCVRRKGGDVPISGRDQIFQRERATGAPCRPLRTTNHSLDIRACCSAGRQGHGNEISLFQQLRAEVKAENSCQRTRIGLLDRDLPIEPARALYGGVDTIGMVRRGDHDDACALLYAGELLQQQIHNLRPVLDVIAADLRSIRDSIHLIDEKDARCLTSGSRKGVTDGLKGAGEIGGRIPLRD